MSCMTRALRKELKNFLIKHRYQVIKREYHSSNLRHTLVNSGLCPSTLTNDQLQSVIDEVFVENTPIEFYLYKSPV
jgi:hypothetical protein